jgi:flavorubredoxin
METQVDEIGPRIYRLSTYVAEINFTFNQYVIDADEPLLFHTGFRRMFPLISSALARIFPVERLRWITFGHAESDENGSMNAWLAAAPRSQVAHGALGCQVGVNDQADRPPRPLAHGDVLDLGGRRVRRIETPHVPHGWDAGVYFEEITGTLLGGDLFAQVGQSAPLVERDIVGPAIEAEDFFRATCVTAATAPTIRSLAELRPRTITLMHGPAFTGDVAQALRDLADAFEQRLDAERTAGGPPSSPFAGVAARA